MGSTTSTKATGHYGTHEHIAWWIVNGHCVSCQSPCKTVCTSVTHVGQAEQTNSSRQREKIRNQTRIFLAHPLPNKFTKPQRSNSLPVHSSFSPSCGLTLNPGSTAQLSQWRPAGTWWFLDRCTDRGLLGCFMGAASQV